MHNARAPNSRSYLYTQPRPYKRETLKRFILSREPCPVVIQSKVKKLRNLYKSLNVPQCMGNIIEVDTSIVRPSQDFLKPDTLRHIFTCYFGGDRSQLPPAPIVRVHPAGGYIAIDGHNLLAIDDLLGYTCRVYVANNPTDELTPADVKRSTPEALAHRNVDLKEKFDSSLERANQLSSMDLGSFGLLRSKYAFLKDTQTAKKYFQLG